MSWTKEELSKIKAGLPSNGRQLLADQFNFKPRSIGNILNGLSNNDDVVLAAIDLANEHKKFLESKKATAAAL